MRLNCSFVILIFSFLNPLFFSYNYSILCSSFFSPLLSFSLLSSILSVKVLSFLYLLKFSSSLSSFPFSIFSTFSTFSTFATFSYSLSSNSFVLYPYLGFSYFLFGFRMGATILPLSS